MPGLLLSALLACATPEPTCVLDLVPGPADAAPVRQVAPPDPRQAGPWPVATSLPEPTCPELLYTPAGTALFASWPTKGGDGARDLAPGRWPVVLFAHGAFHAGCSDLHRAFRTLHAHWASHGFVVLSLDLAAVGCGRISAGDLEARADGLAGAYAALEALDRRGPLAGHLDRKRVVLAGHSRGGGAALMAAARLPVQGVLALQPVDPSHSGATLEPVAVPALVVTAEGDTDVAFPHGQAVEARLRGPWSFAGVVGGVHAFSSDALPLREEDRPGLSRGEQLGLTGAVSTAFLGRVLHGWEGDRLDLPHLRWRRSGASPADRWTATGFVSDRVGPAYTPRSWERGTLYEGLRSRTLEPAAQGGRLCLDGPPTALHLQVAAVEPGQPPRLAVELDGQRRALDPRPPLGAPYQDLDLALPPGTARLCLLVEGGGLRLRL